VSSPVYIGDTSDLRTGAPLHERLLALLPLVGQWQGSGAGTVPSSGAAFSFVQQVTFAHDGRPFLVYESRTWLVDEHGVMIRPAARETGFWRPGAGEDDIEVVLGLNTGLTEILTGAAGDQRWELSSASIVAAPSAVDVDGNRRLYAIVGDELAYAHELAPAGQPFAPHLSARLYRLPV
jgi:hypothetical protein